MSSRARSRRRYYARGKNAVAECMRSGQKMPYKDLVEDAHVPGLLVHPDWWEPRHPQELPVDTSDAVALYRPAPEISVNEDEFRTLPEWEAWIIGNCPASPFDLQYFESTTVGTAPLLADRFIRTEDAVDYGIYDCLYVEIDGGGWFISVIADDNPTSPQFRVPSVIPWGTDIASIGNQVFIGTLGSGVPLFTVSWVVT